MASIRTLFGRHKEEENESEAPGSHCPHTTVVPHWDDPKDLGHEDLASSFLCQGCNETFTQAEMRELRATEAERLKADLGIEEPKV